MGLQLLFVHVGKFSASGYEHGQHILLFPLRVLPVVFQDSDPAHLIQQLLERLLLFSCCGKKLIKSHRLTHLHLQCHFRHLIGYDTGQPPVFRIFHCHLMADPICDLLPKL